MGLVPDNTVKLSRNHPLSGKHGSLNFDFAIAPYIINLSPFLFSLI